jgi:hypothetical protein
MRKALFVSVLVGALAYAAPASAGCWATVQLAGPPAGTKAGATWTAEITVFQHGRYPLPDAADARPTVTIANSAGDRKTFTAKPVDPAKGTYAANVVFPSGGTWTYAVFDDFTSANGQSVPCSQTHELGTAKIGGPPAGTATTGGGSFPVWPVTGAFSAALLIVAGAVFFAVRARRTAVA